jgi:hypothetical protein
MRDRALDEDPGLHAILELLAFKSVFCTYLGRYPLNLYMTRSKRMRGHGISGMPEHGMLRAWLGLVMCIYPPGHLQDGGYMSLCCGVLYYIKLPLKNHQFYPRAFSV